MSRLGLRPALLFSLIFPAVAAGGASQALAITPDLTFGVEYQQGPFLGEADAGLGEAYLLAEAGTEMGRIGLRIPYARIDRTGLVTMASDAPIILGAGGPGKPPWQETDPESEASDLGDLLVRYDTYLVRSGGKRPALTFVLDYKYGMADEKKGLGTGESDWGGGIEYVQPLGKVFQLLVTGLYTFMGSPEGVKFEDRLHLSAGFGLVGRRMTFRVVGEHVTPALEEVPVFDTVGVPTGELLEVEDYRVVRGDFVYRSNAGGSTRLYALVGLNDSSPDIGFGLSFSSRGQ